jgi:hypothetical protein
MKNTVSLRTPVRVRWHATLPDQVFAFMRAIASEFRRAIAAASRYDQLRLKPRAGDDPPPARRTYLEFYSDDR